MKNQKQQFISKFFTPKRKPTSSPSPERFSKIQKSSVKSTITIPLPAYNPILHQKFVQKLLEPTSHVSSEAPSLKNTPLEQQFIDLKTRYPDVLLMIEVGYKYRFFGEDAEKAASVLGIQAYIDHSFYTASIPSFRLSFHLRRLVNAGYKVGVVKQKETAAIKARGSNRLGPFSRGLSAIYTKGTVDFAEDLGHDVGEEEGCSVDCGRLLCVVDEDTMVGDPDFVVEEGFDVRIGIVSVDLFNGDVGYSDFGDNFLRAGLESMVSRLCPVELLIADPISKNTEKTLLAYAGPASNVRVENISRHIFKEGGALPEIISLYTNADEEETTNGQVQTSEMLVHENFSDPIKVITNIPPLALQALALMAHHLKVFGFERILHLGSSFHPLSSNMHMTLPGNLLQQLEVVKNNSDGSQSGSLLRIMNHTLTKFGSRLLRHWVTHPLCDRNAIYDRLDAVSEIASGYYKIGKQDDDVTTTYREHMVYHTLFSVLTMLRKANDVQCGITRIFHRTATASEFIAVITSILHAGKELQKLRVEEKGMKAHVGTSKSSLLRKLILAASSSSMTDNAEKLLSFLSKEAANQKDLSNLFISEGDQFREVAKARVAVQIEKEKLDSMIYMFRKQLGKSNLEFMSLFGVTHLLELPIEVNVPATWVKVNSTKKTTRYHPPEVIAALGKLSLVTEELTVVCQASWDNFIKGFDKYYMEFQAAVQALGALDCIYSLAILAIKQNYVRPEFVKDDEPVQIHISDGRHPVLESVLDGKFVPNDTSLNENAEYCQVITGPNMGGKSCYIRQVALITLMAQVGSFVPARSVKLHVLDGIYTRIGGASDNIQKGRSTFLEELSEASDILRACTKNSLVIIDELGRGTSTHDGVSIAYAALHHLLKDKRSMTLFVTHYPEVVNIKNDFPDAVGTYHVSYLASTSGSHLPITTEKLGTVQDITYLYKLVPGISHGSFGFIVAKLAQLPLSCLRKANFMSRRLESAVKEKAVGLGCMVRNENCAVDHTGLLDLFSMINAAVGAGDDEGKCIQILKEAMSISPGLLSHVSST